MFTFVGDCDLLGNLLSQLTWIMATAKSGNAMSLLADYRLYKSKIPPQVFKILSLIHYMTCQKSLGKKTG